MRTPSGHSTSPQLPNTGIRRPASGRPAKHHHLAHIWGTEHQFVLTLPCSASVPYFLPPPCIYIYIYRYIDICHKENAGSKTPEGLEPASSPPPSCAFPRSPRAHPPLTAQSAARARSFLAAPSPKSGRHPGRPGWYSLISSPLKSVGSLVVWTGFSWW